MEPKKNNLTFYFTVIGSTIGLVSVILALKQYHENKELRAMQSELTALQLAKAKAEAATATPTPKA